MRKAMNYVAKMQIAEVAPGVWEPVSMVVRRNKRRNGVGAKLYDEVECTEPVA